MNAPVTPELFLQTGQFYFGGGRTRVRTLLGTCVSIVVWHPKLRIGGMCHYLLPKRLAGDKHEQQEQGMYADEVMELFARQLATTCTRPDEYVVKVFGGGHMFLTKGSSGRCPNQRCSHVQRTTCHEVGCRNVQVGRELLAERGYKIAVEHVGGLGSRQLVFDVSTGDVWLRHFSVVLPSTPSETK